MTKNTIGISIKKSFYVALLAVSLALCNSCNTPQTDKDNGANNPNLDTLKSSFLNPPPAARPGVFWFWMGGLISQEGITKDLEAMAAQGVGKVLIMQCQTSLPILANGHIEITPAK